MSKLLLRASILLLAISLFAFGPNFAPRAYAQEAQVNSVTISGSVSDDAGKPVVGAAVVLSGPKNVAGQTDAHGLFVFIGMPLGTYEVSVTSASLGKVRRDISVQADTNVAIEYEPVNGLKTIASVSTNARFNVTPASVTHVNPMQAALEGQTSWRKILEQIPGVVSAGVSTGNTVTATMPDSPLAPVLISINGGLPYETATLLDDMPLISAGGGNGAGSGTDLSVYPLNGFSGADVVRGPGAGAPSIVDSIGGSFVLHMPGVVNANHYAFSTTTDAYGGWIVNSQVAVRWKKLSVVATYGFNNSPGPFTGQTMAVLSGNSAIAMIDGKKYAAYTPPCPPSVTCQGVSLIAPGYSPNSIPIYGKVTGLVSCCVDRSAPWGQHSGSLAFTYALSPAITAQVSYTGQQSQAVTGNNNETLIFAPLTGSGGYNGPFPTGRYAFPQDSGFESLPESSASSLVEEKVTARIGRGILKLAALQDRTYTSFNAAQPSGLQQQLYGVGFLCSNIVLACNAANPTRTFTVFSGETHTIGANGKQSYESGSNNRDGLISYETPIGNLYAGASFVQSYYNNVFSQSLTLTPTLTLFSYCPPAISQTTREARLFLGGNLSEKTTLDLSMYFVKSNYHVPNPNDPNSSNATTPGMNFTYSDIDYTYAAPRIGFVWRPTAQVAVRASAGGGFAQAPLQDMIGNNIPQFFGFCYFERASNVNLQPEKSSAFDVGTDLRLQRSIVLSFDVFRADLHGQLYSYVQPTGTFNDGINGAAPLEVQQFVNLTASRYEGISVDLRHEVSRGVTWSVAGGLTRGYVVSVPPGFYNLQGSTCNFTTTAGCVNLSVVPGVNFNGTYSAGAGGAVGAASVPYAQASGSLGYSWKMGRSVGLNLTYYGNNNSYYRPPFVTVDGNVNYPVTNHISLALAFHNITGIYDSAIQSYSASNFVSVPAIAGLPYALYSGQVGPRTVTLTIGASL